jgi:hypothetical protein
MSGSVIRRGAGGHFAVGQSGNPGGRTSALTEVRALMKPHAGRYVEALHRLLDDPDPSIRLAALKEAFDRLLGKAVVAVEQDTRTWDMASIQQAFLTVASGKVGGYGATIEGEAQPTPSAAPPPPDDEW